MFSDIWWSGLALLCVFVVIFSLYRVFKPARSSDSAEQDDSQQINDYWHASDYRAVFERYDSNQAGLSSDQAKKHYELYGANRLPEPEPVPAWKRFLHQFHNLLIYVLIVAGVVTALLQHWLDASVIFGVVVINALIGYLQEGKAENALNAIRQMLSPQAMVLRDEVQLTVDAEQLVVGDVVLLQSGDRVPADLRLFRVKGLQLQESALTGESMAVEKGVQVLEKDAPLGDRTNMAYSGTLVTHGQARGVVVATGVNTEIGRIGSLVAEVKSTTTPLLRQMDQFGRWLTFGILAVAVITFLFGILLQGYQAADMFLASVSLAVAAIPEGLPAIMTITLAIGVQRMAQRNAIIRKLPAVETLGSVMVICSDKTGTLTRNEMAVRTIVTCQNRFSLTGDGYDPHGSINLGGQAIQVEDHPQLGEVVRAGVLCNDASLQQLENNEWRVHGDPMEGALLVAGVKAGLDTNAAIQEHPRSDLIPFESEHRFMATLHHSHSGGAFIIIKGAPEKLLDICRLQRTLSGDESLDRQRWLNQIDEMAKQGQRVLAIAIKPTPIDKIELDFQDVEQGMILLGMFGLIDPPRSESIEAINQCQQAGIRVKMITGDHGATALAIARQLHLVNSDDVLTGQELQRMDDQQLSERVMDVDVFARVSPEHKLRLVSLLQDQQQVVAMTGDGINDSPALKRADVGTAMGQNGTEAAKEASEMVLADDNFASIISAVEEGRTVYDNLQKAILFILPTNGGEALIILAAIVLGFNQLPLTPVQILWVNMITAVTLALALAMEPSEPDVMRRKPREAGEPLLTPFLLWRILFVSIILTGGTFGLFIMAREQGLSIEEARTIAVNTLVMYEIFYLFNSRYITASIVNWGGFLGNRYVLYAIGLLLIFQMGFTYLPQLQFLFGTAPISPGMWLVIVMVASSVLILVEIEKLIYRKINRNRRIRNH
ncbi:cation-transporting P-type ATPase [Candidatus Thiodiazotropha endoloripes]|uniref:cation-transporting P-type ATPase n=1 Tax=Candidatus Thiodiazotropha endoloripes TaxID=1818881 RepID=UPI0009F3232F|nr:cation-transporting P-type ATPase [Candidatus Thiodiazotropha endoloripes]